MGVRDFGLEVTDSGVPAHTSELACVHCHSRGPRPPTNQPTTQTFTFLPHHRSPPLTATHSVTRVGVDARINQSINQSLRCVALRCTAVSVDDGRTDGLR